MQFLLGKALLFIIGSAIITPQIIEGEQEVKDTENCEEARASCPSPVFRPFTDPFHILKTLGALKNYLKELREKKEPRCVFLEQEPITEKENALEPEEGARTSHVSGEVVNASKNSCKEISVFQKNPFYFFGDFLYLKAIEDSLIYAESVPQTMTYQPKVKNIKQDFSYEPAFRIGVGYDFDQSRWKLRASWFYYATTPPKRRASDAHYGLLATLDIPVWGSMNNSMVNSLNGKWHLKMHVLDIDVRRSFRLKGLCIAPASGIKLTGIEQQIHAHYGAFQVEFPTLATPHDVRGKSTFFGIGPLLGMELHYTLPKRWQLFFNGYFSWLVGEFNTTTTYKDFDPTTANSPPDSAIRIKNHMSRIALFQQAQAGIDKRWEYKNCTLGMAMGWELQVFQNQMNLNYFSTFVSPPSGSDLSLYGPFIRARIDF